MRRRDAPGSQGTSRRSARPALVGGIGRPEVPSLPSLHANLEQWSLRAAAVLAAATLGALLASACKRAGGLSAAQRGEVIYRTNCTSCHNADPNLPGPVGPPIAGAPRTLLEARVLHGTYPPGYHPQRSTHTMRALPWLDGHVGDLAAYLASVDRSPPGARPRG